MAKFWPQMAKLWTSQNFPGINTMIFSKKTTRVVSIPKIMKIYSGVWKILAKNTQKWLFWPKMAKFWPFFGHLGVKKFFDWKNLWWSSKSYGDTTSCKKLKKKYWTVKAVGPERTHTRTDEWTDAWEWIYRFLPESKDIRGTKKGSKMAPIF